MTTGVWTYTLLSVTVVSLLSLIGVITFVFTTEKLKKILFALVSFAVGGLFGDAFIHLIPESFKIFGPGISVPACILMGIMIFFALEKFIRWRHCHAYSCENHTQPLVAMNLVGDAAHNLIDGMLIGASYEVSIPIGVATTLAIILHEIPHELGNFGIFVHGGLSVRRALLLNFLSALMAIAGAIISLIVGQKVRGFAETLLPITAGGFIYIAGSDLIPELHHEWKIRTSLIQFICILMGLAMMAALILV